MRIDVYMKKNHVAVDFDVSFQKVSDAVAHFEALGVNVVYGFSSRIENGNTVDSILMTNLSDTWCEILVWR